MWQTTVAPRQFQEGTEEGAGAFHHEVVAGVVSDEPAKNLGVNILADERLRDADAVDGFSERSGDARERFLAGAVSVDEAFAGSIGRQDSTPGREPRTTTKRT